MELLYNSENFAVLRFGAAQTDPETNEAIEAFKVPSDGYEIVDKLSRKEIFLQGLVAESFQRGVDALVEQGPDAEALDSYIAQFTVLAQQPVLLH